MTWSYDYDDKKTNRDYRRGVGGHSVAILAAKTKDPFC